MQFKVKAGGLFGRMKEYRRYINHLLRDLPNRKLDKCTQMEKQNIRVAISVNFEHIPMRR